MRGNKSEVRWMGRKRKWGREKSGEVGRARRRGGWEEEGRKGNKR